jgi:ABC-type branched-subunit amino acid transport system permease subunit
MVGIARLPYLCLGGIAALGAAAMPLLTIDLGWGPGTAVAVTPVLGLVAGTALWLLVRRLRATTAAVVTLALLLCLAAFPAVTPDPDHPLPALATDTGLLVPLGIAALFLLLAWCFAASPAARLHEAAREALLPADGLGLDQAAFRATASLLAAALAAMGGAIMALGPAPVINAGNGDWAALSLALFAIGRLGGGRLGAALLAALPLALLPKLTVTLAPGFPDLTLATALGAILLHLVVRPDGSPAWQPPSAAMAAARLPSPGLAGQ